MFCPQCGKENTNAANFCGKCGNDLRALKPKPSSTDSPSQMVDASSQTNNKTDSQDTLPKGEFRDLADEELFKEMELAGIESQKTNSVNTGSISKQASPQSSSSTLKDRKQKAIIVIAIGGIVGLILIAYLAFQKGAFEKIMADLKAKVVHDDAKTAKNSAESVQAILDTFLRLISCKEGCKDFFNVEEFYLDNSGIPAYHISGTTLNWCGATGNCSHWIMQKIDNGFRIIFEENGTGITHLDTKTNGYYDISISFHMSATKTPETIYIWNGSKYIDRDYDIHFAETSFLYLLANSPDAEKNIDWEEFRIGDKDIGMTYKQLPNEIEKANFRKSFISELSSSSGGRRLKESVLSDELKNWRIYKKEFNRTIVAVDGPTGNRLLFTISTKDNISKISAIDFGGT